MGFDLKLICLVWATLIIGMSGRRIANKRQNWEVLQQAFQGDAFINVHYVRSRMMEVGFNYTPGAVRYRITAALWMNGVTEAKVPAVDKVIHGDLRVATLKSLRPGREYMVRVQGLDANGEPVGVTSSKVIRTSQRCYVCNGKRRNQDCKRFLKECPAGQGCLNVVRYSNGIPFYTKMCGQWRQHLADATTSKQACRGNTKRNGVCATMCRNDLCNKKELPVATDCREKLRAPRYGSIKCTKGKKIGSVCGWSCDAGFVLTGERVSECLDDRLWSVPAPPTCSRPITKPPMVHGPPCGPIEHVANSTMVCTNKQFAGSVCTFFCFPNFFLFGHMSRTCDPATGKWDGTPPRCADLEEFRRISLAGEQAPARRLAGRRRKEGTPI